MVAPNLPPPSQRIRQQRVFRSPLVQIGRFDAPAGSDLFRAESPPGHFAVVFPGTSVRIRHEVGGEFVTDRQVVVFYNPDDRYRRSLVDPRGDFCTWISAAEDSIREITGADTGARPFSLALGPCSPGAFLRHRNLMADLRKGTADRLQVEETTLDLIALSWLSAQSRRRSLTARRLCGSPSRWLVGRAREYLAEHYADAPSLDEIAAAAGCSSYYLCRVFRQRTGQTLHQYRVGLALRHAVDMIRDGDRRLSDIAADLGFSSHSHLTGHFVRTFGVRPSDLRR